MAMIFCDNVTVRTIVRRGRSNDILRGVSVSIEQGERVAIMGPSGSGKSTLLHCMAGLERPTSGTIAVAGIDIGQLKPRGLARLRRETVSVIFQDYNLLPYLSVYENVVSPRVIGRQNIQKSAVLETLDACGIAALQQMRPTSLSGGERQRVAIARSLISGAPCILADEPTGALDMTNAADVMALLHRTVVERAGTLITVTHDAAVAAAHSRVLFLADGQLCGQLVNPTVENIQARAHGEAPDPAAS